VIIHEMNWLCFKRGIGNVNSLVIFCAASMSLEVWMLYFGGVGPW
jgi:hypothetical protein